MDISTKDALEEVVHFMKHSIFSFLKNKNDSVSRGRIEVKMYIEK